jgi:hypothetical protein
MERSDSQSSSELSGACSGVLRRHSRGQDEEGRESESHTEDETQMWLEVRCLKQRRKEEGS